MGVPQIWEILKPHIKNSRVPLKKFVADFYLENGRSPKIAIDCYQWLFECGFFVKDTPLIQQLVNEQPSKPILNFLSRLKEFLFLDITFILVFDGPMKPAFKNQHKEISKKLKGDLSSIDALDYAKLWEVHQKLHRKHGQCNIDGNDIDSKAIKELKSLLYFLDISYLEACGEAEAQCSWLQKNNYVDFVLSNDSDNFFFGCTKLLRNYSRYREDIGSIGSSKAGAIVRRNNRETFVTIVDMNEIVKTSSERLDKPAFLLLTVLLGADYGKGIKGLGKEKSTILASSWDPDFAGEFLDIFSSIQTPKNVQEENYKRFQKYLTDYSRKNSINLFGRNYKSLFGTQTLDGWPSNTAVMYYVNPFIIPNFNPCPVFEDHTNIASNSAFKYLDYNQLENYLNSFHITQVTDFDRWFCETFSICFLLKFIKTSNKNALLSTMKITEQKTLSINDGEFELESWKIRYNLYLEDLKINFSRESNTQDDKVFYSSSRSLSRNLTFSPTRSPTRSPTISPTRSPLKRQIENAQYAFSHWIPKVLIPNDNPLVLDYEIRKKTIEKQKTSPKKNSTRSPKRMHTFQKNTLDSFISAHTSSLKPGNTTHDIIENSIPIPKEDRQTIYKESTKATRRKLFVDSADDSNLQTNSESESLIMYDSIDNYSKTELSPKKCGFQQFIDLTGEVSSNENDSARENLTISNDTSPLKRKRSNSLQDIRTNKEMSDHPYSSSDKILDRAPILNKECSFLEKLTNSIHLHISSSDSN